MKHLAKEQINRLVYYVLNKKILTDELVEAKKHMAICETCYEEFCVSVVAAHDLLEASVMREDVLLYSEYSNEREGTSEKIFLCLKSVAGKIQLLVNDATKNATGKLWEFIPVQPLAIVRGNNDKSEQVFTNTVSEYSCIRISDNLLTIRLDDEFYESGLYNVVLIINDTEKVYPFKHNEMEECFEVVIELGADEYRLEIRGISK